MSFNKEIQEYWDQFETTLKDFDHSTHIEASIAGDVKIADKLLSLFISGKKTAGSSLVKDYKLSNDDLPKVGNYWIVLDSKEKPRVILKTIKVNFFIFKDINSSTAKAEGEGDLSPEYWTKAHTKFFTPYLEDWDITDLSKEEVVTEFFEIVYSS